MFPAPSSSSLTTVKSFELRSDTENRAGGVWNKLYFLLDGSAFSNSGLQY